FTDVDLSAIPCDFYGANCHKWLLAPIGSGMLYVAPGSEDRLEPLQVSWGYHPASASLDERDEYGSTPPIRRPAFEGTRDCCPWLAVPDAIGFQASLGFGRVRARMRELVEYVRRKLDWLTPATPTSEALSGAMMAYELPAGVDPVALRAGLWQERIELPGIERPDRLPIPTPTPFFLPHW